jgi:hypothetical protein
MCSSSLACLAGSQAGLPIKKVPGGRKTKAMPRELVKDLSAAPGSLPCRFSQESPPKTNNRKKRIAVEPSPILHLGDIISYLL